MQSHGLYVTDGDEIDWMYGVHRILSFTVEMADRRYPPDEMIAGETFARPAGHRSPARPRGLPVRGDGTRRAALPAGRTENIPGLVFEQVTVKRVGVTVRGPDGPMQGR